MDAAPQNTRAVVKFVQEPPIISPLGEAWTKHSKALRAWQAAVAAQNAGEPTDDGEERKSLSI